MKAIFDKFIFLSLVMFVVGTSHADEVIGKVESLAVGHPYAPMTLMVSVDMVSEDPIGGYATHCFNANLNEALIISDMSGQNAIDREDTQAYFSLLQTAKITAQDVIVFYHLDESSETYTEGSCVIDAVGFAQ